MQQAGLVKSKVEDQIQNKSGVLYWYTYNKMDCSEDYIGELVLCKAVQALC